MLIMGKKISKRCLEIIDKHNIQNQKGGEQWESGRFPLKGAIWTWQMESIFKT
jgi:hypothetical protein